MGGFRTYVPDVGLGFLVTEGLAKHGLPLFLERANKGGFVHTFVRMYKGLDVLKGAAQLWNRHNVRLVLLHVPL